MKIRNRWEGFQIKAKSAGMPDAETPAVEGLDVQFGGMDYECEISVEEMAQGLKNVREIMDIIVEYIPKIKQTIDTAMAESTYKPDISE